LIQGETRQRCLTSKKKVAELHKINVALSLDLNRWKLSVDANLLTLNSSKTEFLLIGLSKQLAKINSSLTTTHSTRNLGFIFDEHVTFSDQISSVSKSCYYHIRHLRCIRPYLDTKSASTIAISIVHSKLDYCPSVRSRTLLHVLLSKLPNPVTSLPSLGLWPCVHLSVTSWEFY